MITEIPIPGFPYGTLKQTSENNLELTLTLRSKQEIKNILKLLEKTFPAEIKKVELLSDGFMQMRNMFSYKIHLAFPPAVPVFFGRCEKCGKEKLLYPYKEGNSCLFRFYCSKCGPACDCGKIPPYGVFYQMDYAPDKVFCKNCAPKCSSCGKILDDDYVVVNENFVCSECAEDLA